MKTKILVDSSSLISSAIIDILRYWSRLPVEWITVSEIYQETVLDGKSGGHPDSILIDNLFKQSIITIVPTHKVTTYPSISRVDSYVISSAIQAKAIILSNDQGLATICHGRTKLNCLGTPDLIEMLLQHSIITKSQQVDYISALVVKKRLSQNNADQYLLGGVTNES